jgi:uncharacterized protein YjlB
MPYSENGHRFSPGEAELVPAERYPKYLEDRIKTVVEDKLRIQDFLTDWHENVFDKLERADRVAQTALPKEQTLTFIYESEPVINGLIIYGCTRENYDNAISQINQIFPFSTFHVRQHDFLSCLTFLYVTKKGYEVRSQDPKRREIWGRISGYMDSLLR